MADSKMQANGDGDANPMNEFAGLDASLLPEPQYLNTCPNVEWWAGRNYQRYLNSFKARTKVSPLSAGLTTKEQLVRMVFAFFYHSGIRNCHHEPCVRKQEEYKQALPDCQWSPLRQCIATWISCWICAWSRNFATQEGEIDDSPFLEDPTPFLFAEVYEEKHASDDDTIFIMEIVAIFTWLSLWLATDNDLQLLRPHAKPSWDVLLKIQKRDYIRRAMVAIQDLPQGICRSSIWSLSVMQEGEYSNMVFILEYVRKNYKSFRQLRRKHLHCTEQVCIHALEDTTKIPQLHKCLTAHCKPFKVPIEKLEAFYRNTEASKIAISVPPEWPSTAWDISSWVPGSPNSTLDTLIPNTWHQPYIAISHVWSDGTGIGVNKQGVVNSCLMDFWCQIARDLNCAGIWWDSICLPTSAEARNQALCVMLRNYSFAKHVVIHDQELLNTVWSDDESPALAMVISTWFTRAWTTAEFVSANANIKVLFKHPDPSETRPLIVGIEMILARRPPWGSATVPTLAHLGATHIVSSLRSERSPVGENPFRRLLQILRTKSTSWERDRVVIAALLSGMRRKVTALNLSETIPLLTREFLLDHLSIPRTAIFHDKAPQKTYGAWSWCPPSLFDFDQSGYSVSHKDLMMGQIAISEDGFAESFFFVSMITPECRPRVRAFGSHPATAAKVYYALEDLTRCLILKVGRKSKSVAHEPDTPGILVYPVRHVRRTAHVRRGTTRKDFENWSTLSCRYIGNVYSPSEDNPDERTVYCVLGDDLDQAGRPLQSMESKHALAGADHMPWTVIDGLHSYFS